MELLHAKPCRRITNFFKKSDHIWANQIHVHFWWTRSALPREALNSTKSMGLHKSTRPQELQCALYLRCFVAPAEFHPGAALFRSRRDGRGPSSSQSPHLPYSGRRTTALRTCSATGSGAGLTRTCSVDPGGGVRRAPHVDLRYFDRNRPVCDNPRRPSALFSAFLGPNLPKTRC